MASIGVVNAQNQETENPSETESRPLLIYYGVFFDGTGNNMIQKDTAKAFRNQNAKSGDEWETEIVTRNDSTFKNGANQPHVAGNGYSNVALLHAVYRAMSGEMLKEKRQTYDVNIYNIYVEGAGKETDQGNNWKGLGFGKGKTGVCSLVSKAVNIVRRRIDAIPKKNLPNTEIHFDVFGFSRGATEARLFSFLISRNASQRLGCEEEFKDYSAAKFYQGDFLHFLDKLGLKSATVDFLGIYDTVSSIGGVTIDSYLNNTTDYGLYSPTMDNVRHTFHLCAMDEFRNHFALTDIGSAATKGENAELFIPGCHSDVGGSYVDGENSFSLNSAASPVCKFPADKIDKSPCRVKTLSKQTLEDMGWVGLTDSVKEKIDKYSICLDVRRYVFFGYSNIPLLMMLNRAKDKSKREVFTSVPTGYTINEQVFGKWSNEMLAKAKVAKGRSFYYPDNSYTSGSYVKLRKYLHFSSSDTMVSGFKGAIPTYALSTMLYARFVYYGNKGDNSRRYMYQYCS